MNQIILSNIAEGTHEDALSKKAKAAITTRNVLVSLDASNEDQVEICSTSGIPVGVATDEASAGEMINVDLLGCSRTLNILAGGTISGGDLLTIGTGGSVVVIPETAGSYYCIGIALNSGVQGSYIEALTSLPYVFKVEA